MVVSFHVHSLQSMAVAPEVYVEHCLILHTKGRWLADLPCGSNFVYFSLNSFCPEHKDLSLFHKSHLWHGSTFVIDLGMSKRFAVGCCV
jgi:hypothetical protein